MNSADIIVLIIVIAVLVIALLIMWNDHKNGRKCTGCSGGKCSYCSKNTEHNKQS